MWTYKTSSVICAAGYHDQDHSTLTHARIKPEKRTNKRTLASADRRWISSFWSADWSHRTDVCKRTKYAEYWVKEKERCERREARESWVRREKECIQYAVKTPEHSSVWLRTHQTIMNRMLILFRFRLFCFCVSLLPVEIFVLFSIFSSSLSSRGNVASQRARTQLCPLDHH